MDRTRQHQTQNATANLLHSSTIQHVATPAGRSRACFHSPGTRRAVPQSVTVGPYRARVIPSARSCWWDRGASAEPRGTRPIIAADTPRHRVAVPAKSHALDAVGVAHNRGDHSSGDPLRIGTDVLGRLRDNARWLHRVAIPFRPIIVPDSGRVRIAAATRISGTALGSKSHTTRLVHVVILRV